MGYYGYNRREPVKFSKQDIVDLLEKNGYVANTNETSSYIYVSKRDYPNSKISLDYSRDGLTIGYSNRCLRQNKTILRRVEEELSSAIRKDKSINKTKINKQRIKDALHPFKVDLESYANYATGYESRASVRLRMSTVPFFAEYFEPEEYNTDELTITLSEDVKAAPRVTVNCSNLDILLKVKEFTEELQGNWFACGI